MTSKDQKAELIHELKELGRLLDQKTETTQDEPATSNQTQPDTAEIQTTSELAGKNNLLFLRNSISGAIEARTNLKSVKLNTELHKN